MLYYLIQGDNNTQLYLKYILAPIVTILNSYNNLE